MKVKKKFILVQSSLHKSSSHWDYDLTKIRGCNKLKLEFPTYSSARNYANSCHHIRQFIRIILVEDFRKSMRRSELLEAEVRAISQTN